MSSSTLQFVVVGALVATWAWMLGRPLLTNLFRRSRRDSVGHFRYQQAVLGQSLVQDTHSAYPSPSQISHEPDSDQYRAERFHTDQHHAGPVPFADQGERRGPMSHWRAQPVERRRLQAMLGFAIATFLALLMAIALRGFFIRLFLLMTICFGAYLCVAALIGAAQLRRMEQEAAARRDAARSGEGSSQAQLAASMADEADYSLGLDEGLGFGKGLGLDEGLGFEEDAVDRRVESLADTEPSILDGLETYDDLEHFGQGIFDDEFFEPIPELAFRPLNLDDSIVTPPSEGEPAAFGYDDDLDTEFDDGQEIEEFEPAAEFTFDYQSPFDYQPLSSPVLPDSVLWANLEASQPPSDDRQLPSETEQEPAIHSEAPMVESPEVADEEVADTGYEVVAAQSEGFEPTFKAAPEQRPRAPKRNKARPIYIESQLDEEEAARKAVND